MHFIYSLAPSFGSILASPGYACLIICFFLLARFLKLTSFDEKPQITLRKKGRVKIKRKFSIDNNDSFDNFENFVNVDLAELLEQCSILKETYIPPPIWGRNGHLQTMFYGILGHHSLKRAFDKRHFIVLKDGATATFDVFEPIFKESKKNVDITLVFCPGIANCSESNYIRTCVHLLQENGYRCAVLNHLGVLKNVPLTSTRIFSYGGDGELEAIFNSLFILYPSTRFIGVGFSMGANVMTNCLAKLDKAILSRIILAISVCQGYSARDTAPLFMEWESGRRIYNYIITENVKRLLRHNFAMAIQPHVNSGLINEKQLWSSTSLLWLDECYSRRIYGFSSLEDYYEEISCLQHIKGIKLPMIFINSLDDPLIPETLWKPVKDICKSHPLHAFILLKHGGHLGFLEGKSPIHPRSVTWLDRFILQLAEAVNSQMESVGEYSGNLNDFKDDRRKSF
uniref:AB hydrolase-1 domain-containing protein n=1 Tax=Meloidogyne enterolobii TaxID=390850 RepID=A0A6V7USJ7_MELEN|nr:unnamed protein product [Meloidogyne enterolobii]